MSLHPKVRVRVHDKYKCNNVYTCSGNARRVLQQGDVAGKGQCDPTSEKEPAQKSKMISITIYTVQFYKICLINVGKRVISFAGTIPEVDDAEYEREGGTHVADR